MQVVLVMFRADGERRSFSITRDVTVIGRREDCELRIPLGDVSRKHCRLLRQGDELKVEDLGSSNGTYLNGIRVQEQVIQPGDTINVGPVVFVAQIDGMPADEDLTPLQPMATEPHEQVADTGETLDEDFAEAPPAAAEAVGGDGPEAVTYAEEELEEAAPVAETPQAEELSDSQFELETPEVPAEPEAVASDSLSGVAEEVAAEEPLSLSEPAAAAAPIAAGPAETMAPAEAVEVFDADFIIEDSVHGEVAGEDIIEDFELSDEHAAEGSDDEHGAVDSHT